MSRQRLFRKVFLQVFVDAFQRYFVEAHGFTGCGKTRRSSKRGAMDVWVPENPLSRYCGFIRPGICFSAASLAVGIERAEEPALAAVPTYSQRLKAAMLSEPFPTPEGVGFHQFHQTLTISGDNQTRIRLPRDCLHTREARVRRCRSSARPGAPTDPAKGCRSTAPPGCCRGCPSG